MKKARFSLLMLVLASQSGIALAEGNPAAAPPPPPPSGEENLPEYRTKALPTDSFQPSEEVSEDFAVDFPADI
jgi:hypothetical protein